LSLREDIEDIYGQEVVKSGKLVQMFEQGFEEMTMTLYKNALTINRDTKVVTSLLLCRPIQIHVNTVSETEFNVYISPYTVLNLQAFHHEQQQEWIEAFMTLDVFVVPE
jgi:hypothetical protein